MYGKDKKRSSYTVYYDSENHWSVLTQMWGSIWPQVFPYCIINVCFMIALTMVDRRLNKDHNNIEVSTQGHTFVSLVVAFLLVSRVNIALGRYNEARNALGAMYKESRELIQNACVFSSHATDLAAKEWRQEVAYRCLILLRTAMAVIDYPTTEVPAWDVPELSGFELDDIKKNVFISPELRRYAHRERTEWEETMRVPIRIAYLLRKSVHSQFSRVQAPIQISQENKLLASIDGFMGGYYGIRKFLTTPVPFPLIQMARGFVFLYVFTIPFVMLGDQSGLLAHCFEVFLITYGFVGLELTSVALDQPFGDDEIDFDNNALACTAYEDTYLTILDVDGQEWTDKLRMKMHGDENDVAFPSEQSFLLDKVV